MSYNTTGNQPNNETLTREVYEHTDYDHGCSEAMMAIIGFLVLAGLGLFLLVAGLLTLRFGLLISDRFPWEALLIPTIGVAFLFVAWKYAPFTISFVGGAQ
jgi:hypothetical protein